MVKKETFDQSQIPSEDLPDTTTVLPNFEVQGEIEIIPGLDLSSTTLSQGFGWGRRRRLLATSSSISQEDSSSDNSTRDTSSSQKDDDNDSSSDKSGSQN